LQSSLAYSTDIANKPKDDYSSLLFEALNQDTSTNLTSCKSIPKSFRQEKKIAMKDTGWYYTPGDGKTYGPVTLEELLSKITSGQVAEGHHVWHESIVNWQTVSSVPELSSAIPANPPPPPLAPPNAKKGQASPVNTVDGYIDQARQKVEAIGETVFTPSQAGSQTDNWGNISSVAGAVSGGLLFVGLCFTPMACCAVPVSIGGIASALFSQDKRLRKIGLIGNTIVLVLSLAIVLWLSFSMASSLSRIPRL
jgi:hypothetical protein